jgi:hypothetical protein
MIKNREVGHQNNNEINVKLNDDIVGEIFEWYVTVEDEQFSKTANDSHHDMLIS